MIYRRFEDLPVWQEAAQLAQLVLEFTDNDLFRRHYGLRSQLERAAISVSNNIAEGFERGSNNELLAYLYISRGSAGEVRSMLRVLYSWKAFENHKNQISNLTARCETIARQLYGWIEQVKRSDFRGQRHLNVVTKPKVSRSISANHTTDEAGKKRRS
jgi:four helix bundle protein